MNRHRNGPVGQALVALYELLQRRETTFGEVLSLSATCGLDGRRVLADHFKGGVR
ncbi:hypothetical protein [Pseudomonas cichorii]|uniref:Uncharacterized protein n=1 Tax=Pseudomonas cichorii TaxID=36746 RepID=A0ABQ1DIT4_PSECI|nr:hypothetical protein [Pseudomonas cichorii]AHF68723.1 hypothetical protein PCH70_35700 [Pseudomonas cichorii JBC1]QVE15721.1 hypothetical protein KGD89_17750 [Pseudomonas cichorii]GFM90829.1 hypothetical protein PSCICP_08010 [Pseudomonas cichorii]SDN32293.1 hypothetical protein SAMN05216599_101619 [Pseudomonas cichorii]